MPSKAIIPQTSLILYQPTPTRSSFFPFKKSTRKSRTRSFDRHGMPHMAIVTVVVTCKTHATFAGNFAIAVSIGDTLLRRYHRPFPSPSLPSTLLFPPSLSLSLFLFLSYSLTTFTDGMQPSGNCESKPGESFCGFVTLPRSGTRRRIRFLWADRVRYLKRKRSSETDT